MRRGIKRYGLAAALLVLSIGITLVQIRSIEGAKRETLREVVLLKDAVEAGTVLEARHIERGFIEHSAIPEGAFSELSQAIGKTAGIQLPARTLITESLLQGHGFFTPDPGMAMTALGLKPDEALCWQVEPGEWVDLLFVEKEGIRHHLGQAQVKGQFNRNAMESNAPAYMLIQGKRHTIEAVVEKRDAGRIEVIKYTP